MMYKGSFPYLQAKEKLQLAQSLNHAPLLISPDSAFVCLNMKDTLQSVKLAMFYNRPVYQFKFNDDKLKTIYADSGKILLPIDALFAKVIANDVLKKSSGSIKVETIYALDQWIPRSYFSPHLPIHRIEVNDQEKTIMYVSSVTGEVLQKLNANDRFWAWLGPIPHWIYFRDLIVNRPLWRQVIIWTSISGSIMCLFGIVVGCIRFRKKRKKTDSDFNFSPYKKGWFRWHHYIGFVFGLTTFTWVFSGLLSMNPWKWAPSTSLTDEESLLWQGGEIHMNNFKFNPNTVLQKSNLKDIKEISLLQFQGEGYYILYNSSNETELIAINDSNVNTISALTLNDVSEAIKKTNPNHKIREQGLLNNYDSYYYSKNNEKPLPVCLVKMQDDENTSYYINPKTAEVVLKHQKLSRLERWLYNGLHSFDFPLLLNKRPLWDILVIFFLIGGTALSITGLAFSIKWVNRKKRLMIKKTIER